MDREQKKDYIISECCFSTWTVGFAEVVNLLDNETNVVCINIPSRDGQVKYKDDRFYSILPKLALKWVDYLAPLSDQNEYCIDFIYNLLKQYETDKKVYTAK